MGWNKNSGEPEFVFLTPKGYDPIVDHGLLGPTYCDLVAWEGSRFIETYWGGRVRSFEVLVRLRQKLDDIVRWFVELMVMLIGKFRRRGEINNRDVGLENVEEDKGVVSELQVEAAVG